MCEQTTAVIELQERIGYRFNDTGLLLSALTHPSYVSENDEPCGDNQRLEFLGDAVLDFLVAAAIFDRHVDAAEGTMTMFRSQITSGKALSRVGQELELGQYMRMGKGEEISGGRERSSTLADALEAVLGAAYVDGGLDAAGQVFRKLFGGRIDSLPEDMYEHNPKGRLQELCQGIWKQSPQYEVVRSEGPPHNTLFQVSVTLGDGRRAYGEGRSKQQAERRAALKALNDFELQEDSGA